MHRRHELGAGPEGVDLPGEEAHLVPHPLEDVLPLGRLERDAVDAEEPRGDDPDAHPG